MADPLHEIKPIGISGPVGEAIGPVREGCTSSHAFE